MEKIKVKSVTEKKKGTNAKGEPYTIIEVTDELTGIKYDSFADLKEGQEYTGEVKPNSNPLYNASFTPAKTGAGGKNYAPKDWTSEKRIAALNNAVNSCNKIEGAITTANVIKIAELYFGWLNTK